MKKTLFLFLLSVFAFYEAPAQKNTSYKVVYATSDINATTWDTVQNGATRTQTLPLPPTYKKVSVQINGYKIDGTPAGSCKVQRSFDGTNFYDIDSSYLKKKNLLTITNVATAQGTIWELDNYHATHIRTTCTGSGTQRTKFQTLILYNKDNQ